MFTKSIQYLTTFDGRAGQTRTRLWLFHRFGLGVHIFSDLYVIFGMLSHAIRLLEITVRDHCSYQLTYVDH